MKRKIILLVSMFLVISSFCTAQNYEVQNRKLSQKMEKFFFQTLMDNYGFNKDDILLRIFFENFYRNDGEYFLEINRKKIAAIIEELFQDSAFFHFYIENYYVSTPDSIDILRNKLKEMGKSEFSVSHRQYKYKGTVADSKYNVSLNDKFLMQEVFVEGHQSEILSHIEKMWEVKGKEQNMFEFIELALAKPEELTKSQLKAYAAVVFWKYLCYCTNYDLNKRMKKGKYEINY